MIALVSGGSGGLGSAVCDRLAQEGHSVVIGCLTRVAAAEAQAERIRAVGGQAAALAFDVTDEDAVASAVAATVDRFGGIDFLVLAAARNTDGLLAALPPGEAMRIQAVNVGGVMACVAAATPHLFLSEQGRIVTFSSLIARLAAPGASAYAASKGGVEALTRALAVELGPKGVTVNALAPGFIAAGLGLEPTTRYAAMISRTLPARRAGQAADVAAAVAFLVSAEAAYITGAVLPVDGGLSAGTNIPRDPAAGVRTTER